LRRHLRKLQFLGVATRTAETGSANGLGIQVGAYSPSLGFTRRRGLRTISAPRRARRPQAGSDVPGEGRAPPALACPMWTTRGRRPHTGRRRT